MTFTQSRIAVFVCVACLGAAPAWAGPSTSSASADSSATSSGSVSGSIKRSSESSTKPTVADGDYRVIEMAAVTDRPGTVRLTLRAVADAVVDAVVDVPATPRGNNEFFLFMPAQAAERGRMAQGAIVEAKQRPYGVEFASKETQQAFFLVLADEWFHELQTVPVVL